ncbi:DUF7511 domain-containing protein [Natronobiforma cellulositropha]|uniref:DUF7511 domain-containing protein n=1 Tax=Natronobiforma cellulositropha TaxID=1679076 RepID=UPI0021D60948|nr:hypothetical protein [Natronobiforma cellulositropha]
MTANDAPVGYTDVPRSGDLELLTDDGTVWTAVEVAASEDERLTRWLSIAEDDLCDLERWR